MPRLFATCAALFVLVLPLLGQTRPAAPYKIEFDATKDVAIADKDDKGKSGLFITVKFIITLEGDKIEDAGTTYKIIIEEDGHFVKELDVPHPTPSEDLSVVLAMDTSGSMKEHGRMAQARAAGEIFLERLPGKSDCGLILFDHEIRPPIILPTVDREPLLKEIRAVQPRGGTAYLDAAAKGIDLLQGGNLQRERALVVITDGIDINSVTNLDAVVAQAKKTRTKIYTIGIGEPGKMDRVTTALVLDHSGSMQPPASDEDTVSKIEALHRAAARFVGIMPSTGRASLIPFSSAVGKPGEFTGEKFILQSQIKKLAPAGETALFDAVHAGIATLEADGKPGKRAVVAMTDGVDNSSRRRVQEVIDRAKEAKIPLYMLGFGRENEIDDKTMKDMAQQTGGQYYHAKNEKALLEIFENLSIKLHDDGIDEDALTKLAVQTGGRYYPAKNVADLKLILESVTKNIQRKEYKETFPSLRQEKDGTARRVTLKLIRGKGDIVSNLAGGDYRVGPGGVEVVEERKAGYQVHGVVVAEMNYLVYLLLLGILGVLIALPSMMKRMGGAGAR